MRVLKLMGFSGRVKESGSGGATVSAPPRADPRRLRRRYARWPEVKHGSRAGQGKHSEPLDLPMEFGIRPKNSDVTGFTGGGRLFGRFVRGFWAGAGEDSQGISAERRAGEFWDG